MLKDKANVPEKASKLSNKELITYMETVMPDFDKRMVKPRDIKKLITWFNLLEKHGDFKEVKTEEK